jgi:hypothetical protein
METQYEMMNEIERDNRKFMHFGSVEECEIFIRQSSYIILSRCCSGKGFGYYNNIHVKKIKQNITTQPKEDHCSVCLENTTFMTKCRHHLCQRCDINWYTACINNNVTTTCPYCRSDL